MSLPYRLISANYTTIIAYYLILLYCMAMSQQEYEPVPSSLSPIKRYYSDLYWTGYQQAGLITAIDRLYVEVTGQSPSDDILRSLLPNTDDREAQEQLLLLPFTALGSLRELTTSPQQIEREYKDAYVAIRTYTKETHGAPCMSEPIATGNHECAHSLMCPLRAAGHYLMESVIETDFALPEYSFDPMSAYAMACAKAKAFIDASEDSPLFYESYIQRYEDLFVREFIVPTDPSSLSAEH